MGDTQARVYRYGLLPPQVGSDLVDEQIRLAHRYRNALVELELERRRRYREIRARLCPEIAMLEADIDAASGVIEVLSEAVALGRAARHTDSAPSPAVVAAARAHLAELRAARKDAVAALKAARKDAAPAIAEEVAALDAECLARHKALRAACGVYWGTYLLVEEAADRARRERSDPRFRPWGAGDGAVSVQIQGGMSWDDATSCADPRLQIDTSPRPVRDGAKGRARPRIRIRVGSDGRAPVWAEWPLILHRPLPDGAVIKRATAHRTRVGLRYQWHLTLQLALPAGWRREACGTGAVAVHVGWRLRRDRSVRVAWLLDSAGGETEVLLDDSIRRGLGKSDSLRSIRDRAVEELRPRLSAWLRGRDLPAWLAERTATLGNWRAAARFAALARAWRSQRWEGDAEGYEMLESWRYHDQHLLEWEVGQRRSTLARRREVYRLLAVRLAREYETVVLADVDLRQLARLPAPDDDGRGIAAARSQRHDAAVSEMVAAIKDAVRVRGGSIVEVPAAGMTACVVCGVVDAWDSVRELTHACSGCGAEWDQDSCAAHHMLRAWHRERSSAIADGVPARAKNLADMRPRVVAPRVLRLADPVGARGSGRKEADVEAS